MLHGNKKEEGSKGEELVMVLCSGGEVPAWPAEIFCVGDKE